MSQANIALVQSFYAAFGRGDTATIVAATVPDVDWKVVGRRADFPAFGPRKGRAGVQEFFKTIGEELTLPEFSPQTFYAVEDKVFVLGHYSGTVKKTGKPFDSEWIHVHTIRDGQVVAFCEFTDTAQTAEAFRG